MARAWTHLFAGVAVAGMPLVIACEKAAGGVVSAPMTAQIADAGEGDAALVDAAGPARATRPLPPEPTQPLRLVCRREAVCRPEEDEPPALAFAPPFERCLPAAGKGHAGLFSVRETRSARADDPRVCCYVDFKDCKPPAYGRP